MKKEELKLHILAILERDEAHGYKIAKSMEEEGKKVSWGHLYPVLREMEKNGLIKGKKEGKRKNYKITKKGREWLEKHLKNARKGIVDIKFPSISWLARDLQEILMIRKEMHEIWKNIFRIIASRDDEKIRKAAKILERTRKNLEKIS